MTKGLRAAAAALLIAATPAIALAAERPVREKAAKTVPLRITSGNSVRRFNVEIAATPAEQERGLMFRKAMAADHGMIFPMSPPRPASFWMKNTLLSLDIIFIGPDGRILRIAENATPLSLDLIECAEPVAAVLELNGGVARARGIEAGDTVRW